MEKTIEKTFTVDNERVTLELNTSRGYLSLSGSYAGCAGQIIDSIPDIAEGAHEYAEALNRIKANWRAYHLKPLVDVPAEILAGLEADLILVSGARFWVNETPPLDEPDDADFDESNDLINSRDVMKRIETLEACENLPEQYKQELAELKKFESDASGYASDWRYGEQLINDSYFEEYARQFADDVGAVKADATWPNNHIDWEAAAEDLQSDYTAIEFRGVTFWIR